jgi:hypothetical protein
MHKDLQIIQTLIHCWLLHICANKNIRIDSLFPTADSTCLLLCCAWKSCNRGPSSALSVRSFMGIAFLWVDDCCVLVFNKTFDPIDSRGARARCGSVGWERGEGVGIAGWVLTGHILSGRRTPSQIDGLIGNCDATPHWAPSAIVRRLSAASIGCQHAYGGAGSGERLCQRRGLADVGTDGELQRAAPARPVNVWYGVDESSDAVWSAAMALLSRDGEDNMVVVMVEGARWFRIWV